MSTAQRGLPARIPDDLIERFGVAGHAMPLRPTNSAMTAQAGAGSEIPLVARSYEADTQQHINNTIYMDWLGEALTLRINRDRLRDGHERHHTALLSHSVFPSSAPWRSRGHLHTGGSYWITPADRRSDDPRQRHWPDCRRVPLRAPIAPASTINRAQLPFSIVTRSGSAALADIAGAKSTIALNQSNARRSPSAAGPPMGGYR